VLYTCVPRAATLGDDDEDESDAFDSDMLVSAARLRLDLDFLDFFMNCKLNSSRPYFLGVSARVGECDSVLESSTTSESTDSESASTNVSSDMMALGRCTR
jgi:hypothetical protein